MKLKCKKILKVFFQKMTRNKDLSRKPGFLLEYPDFTSMESENLNINMGEEMFMRKIEITEEPDDVRKS